MIIFIDVPQFYLIPEGPISKDREKLLPGVRRGYDMPALLADAFPGVRNYLDASSFLFTGAARTCGTGDPQGGQWEKDVMPW